ncbi:MAG: carbonic anhydrase [Pseudomonadota bacterium]
MPIKPADFSKYVFSAQPDYDEAAAHKEFAALMPLRTIVIYCYDPRAAGIPGAVAETFGDVYPGDAIKDADGNVIGTDATMLTVIVAGGRAIDALRSITVGQHLLGVQNIVVVHHTHCGATSYTADGIIDAFRKEHGADISDLYPRESVCISDFQKSLDHDVRLIRRSPGTPPHADVYGYLYDIETGDLTEVVSDPAPAANKAKGTVQ